MNYELQMVELMPLQKMTALAANGAAYRPQPDSPAYLVARDAARHRREAPAAPRFDDVADVLAAIDALVDANRDLLDALELRRFQVARYRQEERDVCWAACAPGGHWIADPRVRIGNMVRVCRHYDALLMRGAATRPGYYDSTIAAPCAPSDPRPLWLTEQLAQNARRRPRPMPRVSDRERLRGQRAQVLYASL